MNMLVIILLQAECVRDLSTIRAFPQDAIQNMNHSKIKLTMPGTGCRSRIHSGIRR